MTIPTHGSPEYQHPRWLLYAAAFGVAFSYFWVLLAANIFPCYPCGYSQEHGWPLVYMARGSRVPGGITILYGPWPIDNPPLVWFRPTMLLFDVVCGVALTVAAGAIPLYWLRTHPKPARFSLRVLFGLTALVACLLGTLKFYDSRLLSWGFFLNLTLLSLPRLLVYVVPLGLTIIAAHWIVVRSANSGRQRRWIRLHWLTWLAGVAVAGPWLHYSLFTHTGYTYVSSEKAAVLLTMEAYGWPFEYLGALGRSPEDRLYAAANGFPVRCFHPLPLVANILASCAIIGAVGFVVEGWIRRVERGIQMRPRAIVVAVLLVCVLSWDLSHWGPFGPRWYDCPSWLFGIAAMLYTILILVVRGVAWFVQRFSRWSAVRPSGDTSSPRDQ